MRWLKRVVAVGLALVLIWAGLWRLAADEMIARVEAWVIANGNDATRFAHGPLQRAGFPFEVAVDIPDLTIASAGHHAAVPLLRLSLKPWAPNQINFASAGVAALAGPLGPILKIAKIAAVLDRTSDDRERVAVDLVDAESLLPGQPQIAAERLRITTSRKPSDPTPVIVTIDASQLRSSAHPERIDARLEAFWRGAMVGSLADLPAWRDAGGALELRDVAITNGAAKLTGDVILTLDASVRPSPKGSVTLNGVKPFLDRLTALGLTSARDAAIGQVALSLMAKPGADGQPEVTLPISGKDGWLMIGPLRLTRMPPLLPN